MEFFPSNPNRNFDPRTSLTDTLNEGRSTGEIASAGVSIGFNGPGSFSQDIDNFLFSQETGQETQGAFASFFASAGGMWHAASGGALGRTGQPLNAEEWKQSEYYRDGLEYVPGMTDVAASILAERKDRQEYSDFMLEKAEGWQNVGYFGSALAGGLGDAKGLALGFGAGAVLRTGYAAIAGARGALAGGALTTAARARVANLPALSAYSAGIAAEQASVAARMSLVITNGRASMVAGEAVASTVPVVLSGIDASKNLQEDYGLDDAGIDLAASVMLSLGLHTIGKGLSRLWGDHSSLSDRESMARAMLAQFENGEIINLKPLAEAQMSGKVLPYTTLESGAAPSVRKSGKFFEAFHPDERGMFAGVITRGKTEQEAIDALAAVYNSPDINDITGLKLPKEYASAVAAYTEISNRIAKFDANAEARAYAKERGVDMERIENLVAKQQKLSSDIENMKAAKADKEAISIKRAQLDSIKEELLNVTAENKAAIEASQSDAVNQQKKLSEHEKYLRGRVIEMQERAVQPALKAWATSQSKGSSRTNSADPLIRGIDPQELTAKSAAAPKQMSDMEARASEERAKLDVIAVDNKQIAKSLEDIDNLRDTAERFKSYLACIGGA